MSASKIVNKVWNYAHVLRDDGVGYGDYVEQITFPIFLKMAEALIKDRRLVFLEQSALAATCITRKPFIIRANTARITYVKSHT